VISLSGNLPESIFSREGDIASTQNILISFKPSICKLNYSYAIILFTTLLGWCKLNYLPIVNKTLEHVTYT
jgi:hypothetical protein